MCLIYHEKPDVGNTHKWYYLYLWSISDQYLPIISPYITIAFVELLISHFIVLFIVWSRTTCILSFCSSVGRAWDSNAGGHGHFLRKLRHIITVCCWLRYPYKMNIFLYLAYLCYMNMVHTELTFFCKQSAKLHLIYYIRLIILDRNKLSQYCYVNINLCSNNGSAFCCGWNH